MLLSHLKHFSNEILSLASGLTLLFIPSFGDDILFWLEVGTKSTLFFTTVFGALRAFDKYKKKK